MALTVEMDYSKSSEDLDGWFELNNPLFMLITIGIYLLLIYKCLPEYMKNRKAYNLKTFIAVYNILQVVACSYIIISIFGITSTKVFKFWKCSIFESNSHSEYLFNRLIRFTFWLKLIELSETIIFVLRKKQKQVSWLHVFHHCTTLTLVFVLARYYRGGSALYPLFLNSTVHTFMYSYYLLAAVCEQSFLRRLLPVKKSITLIQMLQFILILAQAFSSLSRCNIHPALITYYCAVIIIFFYGFYDFYQKSYTSNVRRSTHKKRAMRRYIEVDKNTMLIK